MASKPIIYAMIPARIGSSRLKMKNLALLNGNPLIYYAIKAAKASGVFDKIIINSDHKIFSNIARENSVEFYSRPNSLGSSQTRSDSVIANFIDNYGSADILVWVNPIAPFLKGEEVFEVVEYFINHKLDSLITAEEKNVHCNYEGLPINYNPAKLFSRTQDLKPVYAFSYSIMMWDIPCFKKEFKKFGHALFCGNFNTFSLRRLSCFIVKNQEDLIIANCLMKGLSDMSNESDSISYHPLVKSIQN